MPPARNSRPDTRPGSHSTARSRCRAIRRGSERLRDIRWARHQLAKRAILPEARTKRAGRRVGVPASRLHGHTARGAMHAPTGNRGSVSEMANEHSKDEKVTVKTEHEPPAGAQTSATWTAAGASIDYTASANWIVLRKKGEAGGGDLLGLVHRRWRWRPSGELRLQRRPGRVVGIPPHGRSRAAAGGVSGGRHAAPAAASSRLERGVVARLHRSRVRRPGRHRFQPCDRGRRQAPTRIEKKQENRDDAGQQGILRLQARS